MINIDLYVCASLGQRFYQADPASRNISFDANRLHTSSVKLGMLMVKHSQLWVKDLSINYQLLNEIKCPRIYSDNIESCLKL